MARATGDLIARKYHALYVDAGSLNSGVTPAYTLIGTDIEDLAIELNPDIETLQNILGQKSVKVNGYDPSFGVETFYAYEDDALYLKLKAIYDGRLQGSQLDTTFVEVIYDDDMTVVSAYRSGCKVIPQSLGGDTKGLNIPFEVQEDNTVTNGARTSGTWNVSTSAFTPS